VVQKMENDFVDPSKVLKRRLSKALKLAAKLKKQTIIEQEVNKELARRFDKLKKIHDEILLNSTLAINETEMKLEDLFKSISKSL
jgi:hypothetical protein